MNYLHWPEYFEKNDSSIAYFERCIELQDEENPRPLDILPYIPPWGCLCQGRICR